RLAALIRQTQALLARLPARLWTRFPDSAPRHLRAVRAAGSPAPAARLPAGLQPPGPSCQPAPHAPLQPRRRNARPLAGGHPERHHKGPVTPGTVNRSEAVRPSARPGLGSTTLPAEPSTPGAAPDVRAS